MGHLFNPRSLSTQSQSMNNPIITFLILLALLITACTGENQAANQAASSSDLSGTQIVPVDEASEASLPSASPQALPTEADLPPLPTEAPLATEIPPAPLPIDTPVQVPQVPAESPPPTETLKPVNTPLPFLTPMNRTHCAVAQPAPCKFTAAFTQILRPPLCGVPCWPRSATPKQQFVKN